MGRTLEAYHRNLVMKMEYLNTAARILNYDLDDSLEADLHRVSAPFLVQEHDENRITDYIGRIASMNLPDRMDDVYLQLCKQMRREPEPSLANELHSKFNQQNSRRVARILEKYSELQVNLDPERIDITICSCGGRMQAWPELSEMRCTSCNSVENVQGVAFDENQVFNQQVSVPRVKRHDPNQHCEKWLDRLLAQEDTNIPSSVVESVDKFAVEHYTRNGRLRPMTNMRCDEIRDWLKRKRLSGWYNHAPKIRKIVTARHGDAVVPPELTALEKQCILIEYQLCMNIYNKVIRKPEVIERLGKKPRNKIYNPFMIWHILKYKFQGDPRLRKLLESIHLQSEATLVRNDIIWKEICKERGIPYQATDVNRG